MNFLFHYNALAIIKRLTDFHIALIPCFQEKLPILSINIETFNQSYKQKKSSLEISKNQQNITDLFATGTTAIYYFMSGLLSFQILNFLYLF